LAKSRVKFIAEARECRARVEGTQGLRIIKVVRSAGQAVKAKAWVGKGTAFAYPLRLAGNLIASSALMRKPWEGTAFVRLAINRTKNGGPERMPDPPLV
ncbi:MAG: hypothetical protein RML99_05590, partial [Anaerolineae bacterium]|nr:hypothetical protein [Anaerolineae bacterium]